MCSDQQHFWVSALAEVSQGEARPVASGDRADNLTAANTHLLRALSALKVFNLYTLLTLIIFGQALFSLAVLEHLQLHPFIS